MKPKKYKKNCCGQMIHQPHSSPISDCKDDVLLYLLISSDLEVMQISDHLTYLEKSFGYYKTTDIKNQYVYFNNLGNLNNYPNIPFSICIEIIFLTILLVLCKMHLKGK